MWLKDPEDLHQNQLQDHQNHPQDHQNRLQGLQNLTNKQPPLGGAPYMYGSDGPGGDSGGPGGGSETVFGTDVRNRQCAEQCSEPTKPVGRLFCPPDIRIASLMMKNCTESESEARNV